MNDTIRIGLSAIHGRGVFAERIIHRGSRVIEYLGEKISKTESARRCEQQNWRIFALDEEFDLDGDVDWNPARFANHSCEPNCEAVYEEGRVWLKALRDIIPGEEVTFNYGYDWEDWRDHPCHCGAENCVGFIVAEEYFPEIQRRRISEFPPRAGAPPIVPASPHTNPAANG